MSRVEKVEIMNKTECLSCQRNPLETVYGATTKKNNKVELDPRAFCVRDKMPKLVDSLVKIRGRFCNAVSREVYE